MVNGRFERYLLCPLAVLASLVILEVSIRIGWPIILAGPYFVLAACTMLGGLRSALVAATLIAIFPAFHPERYGPNSFFQIVLFSYGIAGAVGFLRVHDRRKTLEAEYYRLKAIDTYNGNRAKAVEALDSMDRALAAVDIVDVKKYCQVARIKLADTLTLTGSWHEMAKDRETAIEKLERAKKGEG